MNSPLTEDKKLYAERDILEQGQVYCDHVNAMTAERLHAKSDIAAELAHRDIEIERLEWLVKFWREHHDDHCGLAACSAPERLASHVHWPFTPTPNLKKST